MIKVTQRAGLALHSKGKEKCFQHVEQRCTAEDMYSCNGDRGPGSDVFRMKQIEMLACQERKPHSYFVPLVAKSSAFTQTHWLTSNAQLAKHWSDGLQESNLFDLMSSCVKCHSAYWSRGQSRITPICVVYWAIRGLLYQYTSPCWKYGLNDCWAALNRKNVLRSLPTCIPTINCMFVCWGGFQPAQQQCSACVQVFWRREFDIFCFWMDFWLP